MSREIAIGAFQAAATFLNGVNSDQDDLGKLAKRIYDYAMSKEAGPAPAPAGPMARAQQNLAQGGVQTQMVRDLSSIETRWRDALIDNPGDWYNNVGDPKAVSGGGKGPDFRYKHDDNVNPLFLNGRYGPAPAWVFERLGIPFPGQGGQQAAPASNPAPQEVPF